MVTGRRISAVLVTLALFTAACSGNDDASDSKAAGSAPATETAQMAVTEARTLRPGGARNPSTAVDPGAGTVYTAWAEEAPVPPGSTEDPLLQVVVARSDDGGTTFGEPVVASPKGMRIVSYPVSPTQVEVGPKGEVFVLFLENDPVDLPNYHYGLSYLRLVRSDDGGRTFSAPIDVAPTAREGVSATTMETSTLFIAPNGDLYISFLDLREKITLALKEKAGSADHEGHDRTDDSQPGDVQLRMVRSTDGGRTFSPSVLVSKPTCACCGTKVAQGDGTPLYATTRSAWKEMKDGSIADAVRDPLLSVSRDEGATWSGATKISDDRFLMNGCPDVAAGLSVDSKGRLHAAWWTAGGAGPGVYYAVSTDEGRSFSPPVPVLADEWVPPGDVQLVVDDRDRAWVAFEDRRADEEDRIQVVRIDPGGKQTPSSAWPGTAPDLAVGGDGRGRGLRRRRRRR